GEAAHRRLGQAGFKMRPLVNFSRPVSTETGKDVAAFTVIRPERGEMREGRIQMLVHRTEYMVWQKRWLSHANGVAGLLDVVIAVEDLKEAMERFACFTGRKAVENRAGSIVRLDRGAVQLVDATYFRALLPEVEIPNPTFIGGYALAVASLEQTQRILLQN